MDMAKINSLSDQELRTEEAKASEQLFRIRFQKSLGNQEGVKHIHALKVDVARLKTAMRARVPAAVPASTTGSNRIDAKKQPLRARAEKKG